MLEVLNGNVDKGTFLEFMRYCDECISKVITSQVLAGNSTQFGTQALGSVHEGIARNVLEFDAGLIAENITPLLAKMLEYNFSKIAPFHFEIDTNTEKDEKLQAEVYNLLSNMGIQIPLKHLETTFKIEGLEYKQQPQSPFPLPNKLETNKLENTTQSPLDAIENTLAPQEPFSIEEILRDCESFEDALTKIENTLKGDTLVIAKEELSNHIANAMIYGKGSVHNDL